MTTVAQSFCPVNPRYNVPAEGWGVRVPSTKILMIKGKRSTLQGHYIRDVGFLFRSWGELWPHMVKLLGSPKQAEMVREALRLQALFGWCFPKAQTLADKGLASEKTWDRCLGFLRERGWARTWRLYRQDGTQSVNLLDLGGLWEVLRGVLSWGQRYLEARGLPWPRSAQTRCMPRGQLVRGTSGPLYPGP